MRRIYGLLALVMVTATACGDGDGAQGPGGSPDAGGCVPAECTAAMCGTVDDGCGGELLCGECPSGCTLGTYAGNASIADDDDVAELEGYSVIDGSLVVHGTQATSLAALHCLREVRGTLMVGTSSLTSLAGLEALRKIGGDAYLSAATLTSIAALDGLTELGGDLTVRETGATSIAGLGALRTVGGHVWIQENPELTSIAGLDALTEVRGELSLLISDNPRLTSIAGLGALRTAQEVIIENNATLRSIAVGGGALAVSAGVRIAKNARLERIDREASFRSVAGSFILSECPLLADLGGLGSLTEIGGGLAIENTGLRDLTDLRALTSLGQNQATDAHYLIVDRNAQLYSLEGIGALDSVTAAGTELGWVRINENPRLTTLRGLGRLRGTRGGGFSVMNNAALTSLEGVGVLDRVVLQLVIANNDRLASLAGLTVRALDDLTVSGNALLRDIGTLMSVTEINGPQLEINNNASLPSCQVAQVVQHLHEVESRSFYWVDLSGNDDAASCTP